MKKLTKLIRLADVLKSNFEHKTKIELSVFIKYLIVGTMTYLIEFIGFLLVFNFTNNAIFANLFFKIIIPIISYFFQKNYTYKKVGHDKKIIIKFILSIGIYSIISSTVIYLLMIIFTPILSKLISDCILVIFSYYLSTFFIFKK